MENLMAKEQMEVTVRASSRKLATRMLRDAIQYIEEGALSVSAHPDDDDPSLWISTPRSWQEKHDGKA